jgi:uncharacterized protein YbjT (DUF2867 family)
MISVEDIGAFSALAFNHPEEYNGQEIEIAGDELSLAEVAEVLSKEFNKPAIVMEEAREQFQSNKMFPWFENAGYEADIPALRKTYTGLKDFKEWVKNSGWNPFA